MVPCHDGTLYDVIVNATSVHTLNVQLHSSPLYVPYPMWDIWFMFWPISMWLLCITVHCILGKISGSLSVLVKHLTLPCIPLLTASQLAARACRSNASGY